ncbi:MAG TPA: hypothetical protein VM425_12555, partial [Myxococcota bacterium]|nr:hypothetical protein [Myxococcota bacterium]
PGRGIDTVGGRQAQVAMEQSGWTMRGQRCFKPEGLPITHPEHDGRVHEGQLPLKNDGKNM